MGGSLGEDFLQVKPAMLLFPNRILTKKYAPMI